MKNYFFLLLLINCLTLGCQQKNQNKLIVTSDIDHFWSAYDKIIQTKDTSLQIKLLQKLFLDKASKGQKNMIAARNYTSAEYLNAINSYPLFWEAIRENTLQGENIQEELEHGIEKLKEIYPGLQPAKIYFTIGALRSNGTTMDSTVLIGAELAFANKHTPFLEFPKQLSHLPDFFNSEPSKNIVFLNIHEYIHTQQKTTIGSHLLAQTLIEGVAEFVAEKALNVPSPNPQISFGKANTEKIKAKFEIEMFSPYVYNWIWNSTNNEFGVRDLAYFVGYQICENYYKKSTNKALAIKQMIQLDYNNDKALAKFVDESGFFNQQISTYKKAFEVARPKVINTNIIKNPAPNSNTFILQISFSEQMNVSHRNFEIGPLGEENVIRIVDFHGFSKDSRTANFEIEAFATNKTKQLIVGSGFLSSKGFPLIPYLIETKND